MNTIPIEPFLPQGAQPLQPFHPNKQVENTPGIEPQKSFSSILKTAKTENHLKVSQDGIVPSSNTLQSNPFTPESISQDISQSTPKTRLNTDNQFVPQTRVNNERQFISESIQSSTHPNHVQTVNNITNGPIELDQLTSKAQTVSFMRGVNKANALEINNSLKQSLHITKEVAEFRRRKLKTAYSKLDAYIKKSPLIYA